MSDDEDMSGDDECYYHDDYYTDDQDPDVDTSKSRSQDPEYYEHSCLSQPEIVSYIHDITSKMALALKIKPSIAKVFLLFYNWDAEEVQKLHERDPTRLYLKCQLTPVPTAVANNNNNTCMVSANPVAPLHSSVSAVCSTSVSTICSSNLKKESVIASSSSGATTSGDASSSRSFDESVLCTVCFCEVSASETSELCCSHTFCNLCWLTYIQLQINEGITCRMECMSIKCKTIVPEDFVEKILAHSKTSLEKYRQFSLSDCIKAHPLLRFCPGPDCAVVVAVEEVKPKKVSCSSCSTNFCFDCGTDFHSPTRCDVIRKWRVKCADDSETANYISANTKDCPKCNISIEKNGGCNHMHCYNCKFDFCWMCFGSWKNHGSEYYDCSRYKETIYDKSDNARAREALKKYLHYFERWDNHARSLKLESRTLSTIKTRIHGKVMAGTGTWIDWQYLMDAAHLLAKCRYTLQYTYPYAYYMEDNVKALFEHQQAILEAEIENLSWKIERAEMTDRGDLENQMDVVHKRRNTLLMGLQVV